MQKLETIDTVHTHTHTHTHGELLKEKNKKTHNGIIGFWKFMFSLMIVVYHFNISTKTENVIFKYGYIGVEFFFIVSGYLLAKNALNKERIKSSIGEETFDFIWKKIKNFFPYMIISFIITIFVNIYNNGMYKRYELINSIWNLFFLQTSGIKYTSILGQTWYISAMLISMLIIYPLIRKYKKNFVYVIAPIIVIFIGGWLSHTYGTLNGWEYTGFVYKCLLRAFFELSLGVILYEIVEKIKKIHYTKLTKIIFTLIEIVGFFSIFLITNIKDAGINYDFIMLLILSISTVMAFSEKTLFINYTNTKFFKYIEKLSFPIYLNHIWIISIVNKKLTYFTYIQKLSIIIILTILFSIFIMYIVEKFKNNCNTKKIKKYFIIEDRK